MSTPEEAAKAIEGISATIEGAFDDAALLEVGHFATQLVLLRTKTGLDADGKPFAPYAKDYAKTRQEHGLAAQPVDLARTGHMLGTVTPVLTGDGGVEIGPHLSEFEAKKLAAHNAGVDKTVSIKPRRFTAYTVDRRFASEARAMKEGGNAYGGLTKAYTARMRLPKRETMDIRRAEDIQAVAEVGGNVVIAKLEKPRG